MLCLIKRRGPVAAEWSRTCSVQGMRDHRIPFNIAVRVRVPNSRRCGRCAGFSLLETVIALVLLATVMVSIGAGLSGTIRSTSFSRDTDQARLLASQQMDSLRAQFEASDPAVANLTGTVGCSRNTQNEINFAASPVSGYQKTVTLQLGTAGGASTSFDVRWNIQQVSLSGVNPPSASDTAYLLTVGVKPSDAFNGNAVNLHALVP